LATPYQKKSKEEQRDEVPPEVAPQGFQPQIVN